MSEGKNNPIYNAHSYHTKVPHPAIMRYILHYTQPGDIVFDGFAGTGMTGVAAQICENPDAQTRLTIEQEWKELYGTIPMWGPRRAINGDLSVIASFIASNYNIPINPQRIETISIEISQKIEDACGWMYQTDHKQGKIGKINFTVYSDVFVCPTCGKEIVFFREALDKKTGLVKKEFKCSSCKSNLTKRKMDRATVTKYDDKLGVSIRLAKTIPVLINYEFGGKTFEKEPDNKDFDLIEKINDTAIDIWYPNDALPKGFNTQQPIASHGTTHVHHFYTKRALSTLAKAYQLAHTYTGREKAYALFFVEQAVLGMAKIARYVPTHYSQVNQYLSGTLYIGSQVVDVNINYILNGKTDRLPKAFALLMKEQVVTTQSADAFSNLRDNSVDYIFTDPPFGANIMYSELNFFWESWLRIKTDSRHEAIENSVQEKTLLDYQTLMTACLREYYRILKPGKWMTVEFSNTSAAVWNGIQTALQMSGFVLANVAALDKQHGSFKAVTSPTAVKQDLVISCYKPSSEFYTNFTSQNADIGIWNFIREHLLHLPIHIIKKEAKIGVIERSPKILYDRLISFYLMRGLPVPIDAIDFQVGLRQRFQERSGMFFITDQAVEFDEITLKNGKDTQFNLALDIIYSETDAIQWLTDRLKKTPKTSGDLNAEFRKANVATRKGEAEIELRTVLQENFIEIMDGKWRVPDLNEAKDREVLRTKALLKEFESYIAELNTGKSKKLKEIRVETLHAGFKKSWEKKDFKTIVFLSERIPQNILLEDEQLLMFYDIAKDRV